jgi:hypothetical protein
MMHMPDPGVSIGVTPRWISRKCAACDEEAKKLQPKSAVATATASGEAPPIVHEVLRAPGQPLDASMRAFFEPRFGRDLGHVRAHTDAAAAQSAREVGALAYTVGSDIAFASGHYAPNTEGGRRLLAHELTHVVQQSQGISVQLQRWTYEDTCSSFLDVLGSSDDLAKDKVQKAIAGLSSSPPPGWLSRALSDCFSIEASNQNKADLIALILGVYRQLLSHFDAGDYTYECNCNDCPDPEIDLGCTSPGQGPIIICVANLQPFGGIVPTLVSDTIVHEFSHRFAGTDNFSYCQSGSCSDLTSDKAIGNATSYEDFAREAWLHMQSPPAPQPGPTAP